MRRREYMKLFDVEVYLNDKGKERRRNVYKGPYYAFDDTVCRQVRRDGLILGLVALIAFVSAGFISYSLCQHTVWVSVPYVLNVLPLVYIIGAVSRIWHMKNPANEIDRGDGVQQLTLGSITQFLLGAAWAVAALVCIILNRAHIVAWASDIGFMLLGFVNFGCGLLLYRSVKQLTMTYVENTNAREVPEDA